MNYQVELEAKKLESNIVQGNFCCSLHFDFIVTIFKVKAPTAQVLLILQKVLVKSAL